MEGFFVGSPPFFWLRKCKYDYRHFYQAICPKIHRGSGQSDFRDSNRRIQCAHYPSRSARFGQYFRGLSTKKRQFLGCFTRRTISGNHRSHRFWRWYAGDAENVCTPGFSWTGTWYSANALGNPARMEQRKASTVDFPGYN